MNKRDAKVNIELVAGVVVALAVGVCATAVLMLDVTGKKGSGLSDEFVYDIKDLAKVDPALIMYEESSSPAATGFSNSRAIALGADGGIYLAGDSSIKMPGGKTIDLPGEPQSLTVADDGRIYVSFEDHIGVYDDSGRQLAAWKSEGERAVLTAVAVYKEHVFVADAGNRVVVHYDTDGKVINYIGRKDKERYIDGFIVPSPYFDLAVASDGLLRVINPGRHRIEAYTFDGDLEFSWGKPSAAIEGFCGCCNPINFAILEDGSFVTCEKGLTRVKIYDADGEFVGVVAEPAKLVKDGELKICNVPIECQEGGFDIAADANGRVFVLDTVKNLVRTFDRIAVD